MEEKQKNRMKDLPKIDLHCHLDGSMTRQCVEKILQKKVDPAELEAKDSCQNLADYLEKTSQKGLLHPEEHVVYMEVRFASLSSVHEHLSCRQAVEAVLDGLKEAQAQCQVSWNVIACAMRHHPQEDSLAMMKVCREYLGEGLCAVDLAGDEASWPME